MTSRQDEARLLDEAIDALIGIGPDRGAGPLEADLTETARLLADVMPRFHPRFGFEERLARRLSGRPDPGEPERALASTTLPAAAPPPPAARAPAVSSSAPASPDGRRRRGAGPRRERPWRDGRALLRGGALASGVALASRVALASGVSIALPIAGAALMRRRRARAAGRGGGAV